MWALVPFKGADGAKRRLAEHLTPIERRELALAMLADVLTALAGARALSGILLVSKAPIAAKIAARFNAECYAETATDLPGAVVEASNFLMHERDARGTLFIPGDVPLIGADDIETVLEGHESVTLVPDQYDIGTNCAVSSPPNAFEYVLDGKSFAPHCAAARAAGIEPRIVRTDAFGLDIDTVDELVALIRRRQASQTLTYLESSGIASRLSAPHNSPAP